MVLFPQRLKELRTSRNLSLQELADIVNMSKSSVYMWETGEREPGLEILDFNSHASARRDKHE